MSSELLWWLAEKGPQKAAQASPFAIYELAKNKELSAENPLVILHASPTKQFSTRELSMILEPSNTIEFSQITPLPMKTLASGVLCIVLSAIRVAPRTSQLSVIIEFVISVVLTIFTLSPRKPQSRTLLSISPITILRMACVNSISFSYLTINAATCEVRPWKSITLPSPTSLSTDMILPSP